MQSSPHGRITLDRLVEMKRARKRFAMLTAYDYPTAAAAQAAGVHALLVGDSLGCVVLGHENTRGVPLALMIYLAEAVRRGAPHVYLIGDLPFESIRAGRAAVLEASRRFVQEAGCDAVKLEIGPRGAELVRALSDGGYQTLAHLGLRPQSVAAPDQYRAQARDAAGIADLVAEAQAMQAAGAVMILLEAVPPEAGSAVVQAVSAPVVGCGAGPACDAHVVVTHDMLGFGAPRPPRFVPRLADLRGTVEQAMRRYVEDIAGERYPAPEHAYSMRGASTT